jgi:AcrR family transcriptional regulator
MTDHTPGRPRNDDIDRRVLAVARHHLATHGYAAMSIAAIATEANTTRQALYRRWPTKADLATAAIADISRADEQAADRDPFVDLVAELGAFQDGISRPDGLAMIGSMFIGSTDPELVQHFRHRVVSPRRARLRAILQRAVDRNLLVDNADLDTAVSLCTGSWYAIALTGDAPPADWPQRTARAVWNSVAKRRR